MNRKFEDLKEFEEKINYKFKNRNYLISALTHSSYANEVRIPGIVNNERLEFLGDAVLELATSAKIFKKYPNMSEGKMSKYRASIVCEPTLASCSKAISLSEVTVKNLPEAVKEHLLFLMHLRHLSVLYI